MNYGKPDMVIVVDNGSEPPFEPVGLKVPNVVIRNRTNRGFSRACNQGLRSSDADAILFMNNDIRPLDGREWALRVKKALRPGVLVGARLRDDMHTQVDGQLVPYLDGWCIGGMREDLLALGGFDESYEEPAYYADNDLCARAVADGMTLEQIDLPIHHLEGSTSNDLDLRAVTMSNYQRYADTVRALRPLEAA